MTNNSQEQSLEEPKYNPKYHNIYSIIREIFRYVKVEGDFYDAKSAYEIIEKDISQEIQKAKEERSKEILGLIIEKHNNLCYSKNGLGECNCEYEEQNKIFNQLRQQIIGLDGGEE